MSKFLHRFGNIQPTPGQMGDAICAIRTQEQAEDFWHDYVQWLDEQPNKGEETGVQRASSNIGYLMGYYGPEERKRVYKLFPCATHPVFGHKFGRDYEPTADEAIAAGESHAKGA